MTPAKITVRTANGQTIEMVVLSKRATGIQVVLGEGIHNVKCELIPSRNGMAYVGSVMDREIVYERSREQVHADIDRLNSALRKVQIAFAPNHPPRAQRAARRSSPFADHLQLWQD
jgi:hypothetical protein